ncbi:neuromedin U receptor activity protein [Homalodisca vitripennis]|nr:neuromedin U receptor activity protein [Homalodisca vitripennis]
MCAVRNYGHFPLRYCSTSTVRCIMVVTHTTMEGEVAVSISKSSNQGDGTSPRSSLQFLALRDLFPLAVVVAFFICWAPFHSQRLLAVYCSSIDKDQQSPALLNIYTYLTYVSGVLYFLSTTVNPLLYHIMSKKFRQAFKSTLAQLCGPERKGSYQSRSYSILSRGHQNLGGPRSSVSCAVKDPVICRAGTVGPLRASVQPAPRSPIHVISTKLRLTHRSIDSGTISNSSLQDMEDTEYTGLELANYMGELNRTGR